MISSATLGVALILVFALVCAWALWPNDDLTRAQDRVAYVSRYLNARKALLRGGLSEHQRAELGRTMREALEQFHNG